MADRPPVLIYIHGFNSSPNALKAQEVAGYIKQQQLDIELLCPDIPDTPDQAIPLLEYMLEGLQDRKVALIGSSLGGYYATYLAEKFKIQAVLVNPAVRPHELMHHYLGENQNPYSGAQYTLTEDHMQTLQSAYIPTISKPENFLVLLQTGDEVLNALEASQRFYQSRCLIEYGGDHRFQGFERYLPEIFSWLGLQ